MYDVIVSRLKLTSDPVKGFRISSDGFASCVGDPVNGLRVSVGDPVNGFCRSGFHPPLEFKFHRQTNIKKLQQNV